jgi:hypothetical protein
MIKCHVFLIYSLNCLMLCDNHVLNENTVCCVKRSGEFSMDANSIIKEDKKIYDLTEVSPDIDNGNSQEIIVVDGRGYEDIYQGKKEIFTLVDVIEDTKAKDNIYEDIIKRSEEIIERIARKMVPEIAEKIIKEEIEKIKKCSEAE